MYLMRYPILILISIILAGCAVQSTLVDVEPDRNVFVIETAKMKLTYAGDTDADTYALTKDMVTLMQKDPLNDFNATGENYVRVNTVNAKSDSANINLQEGTKAETPPAMSMMNE